MYIAGVLEKESKSVSLSDFKDEKQYNVSEERIAKIAAEYEEKLENLRKQLQEVKEKSGRTILLKAVNQVYTFLIYILIYFTSHLFLFVNGAGIELK